MENDPLPSFVSKQLVTVGTGIRENLQSTAYKSVALVIGN